MTLNSDKIIPIKKQTSSEVDILSDPKYICSSCTIITDSLKKGCDVVQMPNGDIIIREQKVVTTRYSWDSSKEKIVKNSTRIEDKTEVA